MEKKPRTFLAPDLCRAAGLKPSTLRTWHSRDYFRIEKDHEKEWTRYSEADALRVLMLAALVRSGLEPKVAAGILETETLDFFKIAERVRDGGRCFVVGSMLGAGGGLWDYSPAAPKIDFEKDDPNDAVAIVVDLAKLYRNALRALEER